MMACSSCFYWLHQIRMTQRSFDTSHQRHWYNTVFAGTPTTRHSNTTVHYGQTAASVECCSATHVISGTQKYDHSLIHLLHWLNIIHRVSKKSSTSYFAEYFSAGLTDCKNFNGYRVRDNQ